MKVPKSSIICLASEGRTTLQVPEFAIGEDPNEEWVECEEDWFCHLRNGAPVVGRQQGFLYFTRKGYEACKDMLREAFTNVRGAVWADFEKAAEEHFVSVERAKQRTVARLERDLERLRRTVT